MTEMIAFRVATISPSYYSDGLTNLSPGCVSQDYKRDASDFLYQEKHVKDRNHHPKCDLQEALLQSK